MGDWTLALTPPDRPALCDTVRGLSLNRLARYPPPKASGVPVGHEFRVLRTFLTGGDAQFDASGLASLYASTLPLQLQLVRRALVLGEALSVSCWRDLLGNDTLQAWLASGFLEDTQEGYRCAFRVYSVAGVILTLRPSRT